jgi:hypothetical protein
MVYSSSDTTIWSGGTTGMFNTTFVPSGRPFPSLSTISTENLSPYFCRTSQRNKPLGETANGRQAYSRDQDEPVGLAANKKRC